MKTVLVTLAALTMTAAAYAAVPDFSAVDTDGNGEISMDELKAAIPDISPDKVKAADTNGDGQLDQQEYAALTSM